MLREESSKGGRTPDSRLRGLSGLGSWSFVDGDGSDDGYGEVAGVSWSTQSRILRRDCRVVEDVLLEGTQAYASQQQDHSTTGQGPL